jgi:hypothetical protein
MLQYKKAFLFKVCSTANLENFFVIKKNFWVLFFVLLSFPSVSFSMQKQEINTDEKITKIEQIKNHYSYLKNLTFEKENYTPNLTKEYNVYSLIEKKIVCILKVWKDLYVPDHFNTIDGYKKFEEIKNLFLFLFSVGFYDEKSCKFIKLKKCPNHPSDQIFYNLELLFDPLSFLRHYEVNDEIIGTDDFYKILYVILTKVYGDIMTYLGSQIESKEKINQDTEQ